MAASIVIVKWMAYRGSLEEWSNRYHFDGGAPDTDAKWLALDNAIRAAEKLIFTNEVSIIRSLGYTADDTPAVWSRTSTTTGTLTKGTGIKTPGDAACWIRYSTARTDARGHPVYLRNYYHGVLSQPDPDFFFTNQQTAFATYGAAWVAGFSDGTVTHKRTGPDSLGATGHQVSTYIARRKLKRRG
jgi:hypothetical protein